MQPNPQFPAALATFLKKSLMKNFLFCAVIRMEELGWNTWYAVFSLKRTVPQICASL